MLQDSSTVLSRSRPPARPSRASASPSRFSSVEQRGRWRRPPSGTSVCTRRRRTGRFRRIYGPQTAPSRPCRATPAVPTSAGRTALAGCHSLRICRAPAHEVAIRWSETRAGVLIAPRHAAVSRRSHSCRPSLAHSPPPPALQVSSPAAFQQPSQVSHKPRLDAPLEKSAASPKGPVALT